MPYIPTLRLFSWLYVAWHEDDFHRRTCRRFGFTAQHAADRCFAALED